MKKSWKIFLYAGSSFPILWTIAILICAYFYIGIRDRELFWFWTAVFYVRGGAPLLLLSLLFLKWQKKISTKEVVLHLFLTGIGILLGYLSFQYDIFHILGVYLDGSPTGFIEEIGRTI